LRRGTVWSASSADTVTMGKMRDAVRASTDNDPSSGKDFLGAGAAGTNVSLTGALTAPPFNSLPAGIPVQVGW
jgi:hypothetical protein